MNNPVHNNPNDYKVVKFFNNTNFDFVHDMGCMYNSVPISGVKGVLGIASGEEMTLPYHVGNRLAVNLAKMVMVKSDDGKPPLDRQGNPMVAVIWSEEKLVESAKSFLTELYTESKPLAMSETDKLMAKVEEYKKMVEKVVGPIGDTPKGSVVEAPAIKGEETPNTRGAVEEAQGLATTTDGSSYKDKAEVIAELTKRGIPHDKRKNKAELEKLLA